MEKEDAKRVMLEEGLDEATADIIVDGPDSALIISMTEEEVRKRSRDTVEAVAPLIEMLNSLGGTEPDMAMKKHNEMGRKPEGLPDSTRINLTDTTSFDAHLCEDCRIAGHCSIEPLARYFKDHPDDAKEYEAEISRLLSGDWKKVVEADSVILSPGRVVDKLLSLAFGTGYVFAKGQKINDMTMTREIAAEANAAASIAAMMLDIGR